FSGMLRRPKPTDSEEDLLREQQRFLSSSALKRPDKRRGEEGTGDHEDPQEDPRDVVKMSDLPDEIPSLTPAPPKKSRFKKEHVRFEDDDPEDHLNRHDMHISAVLSRIIERDTSTVPVCLPVLTGTAFPKVMRRSHAEKDSSSGSKKSIFARQIEAQRVKAGLSSLQTVQKNIAFASAAKTSSITNQPSVGGPLLVSGQGLGSSDAAQETMKIHQENQARLQEMSQEEILEEQRKLLHQLDPMLVDFVRSQKTRKLCGSPAGSSSTRNRRVEDQGASQKNAAHDQCAVDTAPVEKEMDVDMEEDVETEETTPQLITDPNLPIKVEKKWVHMDKLEPDKLEWTRDLPRRKGNNAWQYFLTLHTCVCLCLRTHLPTHLGLHHHGEDPELAGYSLQELFLLSRSQVTQQRVLALSILANIITKAHAGAFASDLKGSILLTLLDAGLLFLLRFSLDDSVEGVMSAAIQAMRALLVSPGDEDALNTTFPWFLGMYCFPLLPTTKEEEDEEDEGIGEFTKETANEKEERKSDHDVARQDMVKGLLKMKLLPRLRYILEVVRPSPRVVLDMLELLVRIARHSTSTATQILDCPGLMETVMAEFLPISWAPPSSAVPSLYERPVAMAIKLLRVLGTAGRHICARLLNSLGGKERLSRLLVVEPQELMLETEEAFQCSTEAFRLWAVAASYGQSCSLYGDLYPVLVNALQSVNQSQMSTDHALLSLMLQRAQAILVLLTQVTHTAGCHEELQAGLVRSQGAESLPPPPVTWAHVAGLQPTVKGLLKASQKRLGDAGQTEASILPSYLLYLGAFYSQLYVQSSFKPIECLQELESLTSEVLLPLQSHQVVQKMMYSLRTYSAICNSHSCIPGSELVPSLPGLGFFGEKTHPSLSDPASPFPLLTALCYLLNSVIAIHRGLITKFTPLLMSESLVRYMQACAQSRPTLSHCSPLQLRHEHHLLYLLLRLAHRMVPVDPDVAKYASLFHQVALVMLPSLQPGSEYMAHELMSVIIFNQDFIPECISGGPEAAALAELRLQEGFSTPQAPPLAPLLREVCLQLSSVRGCYLTHLAYCKPAVLSSRDTHLGRTPWVQSLLLPNLSLGPALPSDWPFLPLISLYERMGRSDGGGVQTDSLPAGSLVSVIYCLQWHLLLESWREGSLAMVPPVAKLARLACIFLSSSDLFLEPPVQRLMWALFGGLTRPAKLAGLDLTTPPPGLASFHDLYSALLDQFEAVSFGDELFGCFLLLPLQRRHSVTMRLAVFGEHVGLLRSLGVSVQKLPIPLENYILPPEDSLPLLWLYFRTLVMKSLRRAWCPVLYSVAVAHVNAFIFSQDPAPQEVEAARQSMLRKTYYLTDEVLRAHLLLYKLPQQHSDLGFITYEELPPIRSCWLEKTLSSYIA
uniref:RNA polymerase II associated protein 1 n=1 Tax=Denticeps clupeoides TaxID=299321 RepID=A0AAY4C7R7_9TELE